MTQELINQAFVGDIRELIDNAKSQISRTINQEMTVLYWHIGKRIQEEILQSERAQYGKKIIEGLSQHLISEYGKGFSSANLFKMIALYEAFPNQNILLTLSTQLTWSHFVVLLYIKDPLKREFYTQMCRLDRWSIRTLREKIGKLLFERTALAKQPDTVIADSLSLVKQTDRLSSEMILQDPYLLEFLNLGKHYSESDLESAILDEIQNFLLEMGAGFCFVARQKRISVGKKDYWIDLLLYNRYLRRLVIVELKTTDFKPEHKGQMEFYLRWCDQHERRGDDEPPLGIILCTQKDEEQIKLFDLKGSGIHVAEYLTELPPREVFERKVLEVIKKSQEKIAILQATPIEDADL